MVVCLVCLVEPVQHSQKLSTHSGAEGVWKKNKVLKENKSLTMHIQMHEGMCILFLFKIQFKWLQNVFTALNIFLCKLTGREHKPNAILILWEIPAAPTFFIWDLLFLFFFIYLFYLCIYFYKKAIYSS